MTIFLRRDLIDSLIETRYDNLDGLVDEWERRAADIDRFPDFPSNRERSAIHNWRSNGVPTRGDGKQKILALCSLLDVDPMAVVDYQKNRFFDNFTALRMSLYRMTEKSIGRGVSNFAPLIDMFMPGPEWPNTALAQRFYLRDWFSHEFDNSGHETGSDYGLIKIKFVNDEARAPRSAHIAYRRRGSNDKMWRYYGVVNRIGSRLELYTEGGDHDSMDCLADGEIWFRTSFGQRPVEFRLVSLHDFNYSTEINNDLSIIGFNW